jgi:hypothetical protein
MPFFYMALTLIGQTPAGPNPPLTQAQLRQRIVVAIRNHPESIEPADFSITNLVLYYRFGGLKEFLDRPPASEDIPVATQFTVEAIRQTIKRWGPPGRKVFSTYLERVEVIIEKELSLIANFKGSRAELGNKLAEYQRSSEDILLSAVRHFGKKEGRYVLPLGAVLAYDENCRLVYYVPRVYTQVAVKGFEVAIKSSPDGATISYLPSGKYIVAQVKGTLDKVQWIYVLTEHRMLIGEYYFRAAWPNGKRQSPLLTIIDQETTLTIRPDPGP